MQCSPLESNAQKKVDICVLSIDDICHQYASGACGEISDWMQKLYIFVEHLFFTTCEYIKKIETKLEKSWKRLKKSWKNIARGTTDPGYRVYNMNYFFDWI